MSDEEQAAVIDSDLDDNARVDLTPRGAIVAERERCARAVADLVWYLTWNAVPMVRIERFLRDRQGRCSAYEPPEVARRLADLILDAP